MRTEISLPSHSTVTVEVQQGTRVISYGVTVSYVESGRAIVLSSPQEAGSRVLIPAGTQVRIRAPRTDGSLEFSTSVVSASVAEDQEGLCLAWPENVDLVQRRRHVRIPVVLRATLFLREEGQPLSRALQGTTADLSLGGARLILSEHLTPGDAVLHLHLPEGGVREVTVRVLHAGLCRSDDATHRFWAGVEFAPLPAYLEKEFALLLREQELLLREPRPL